MSTDHDVLSGLTLVLAFGSPTGAPDPLLRSLRPSWEAVGLRVAEVALDPAEADEPLKERYVEQVRALGSSSTLILGGFSLGARIAVLAARRIGPLALVCLGYPFHVLGEPQNRHGLESLRTLRTPTLIVQGTRDAHGNQQEVRGYGRLPPCVRIHWLDDGNHRFRPRLRSAQTEQGHLGSAAAASVDFIRDPLTGEPHA